MYDLTASEKANKIALLLVHERYSKQLAPFVKNSKTRYDYVQDTVAKIINEICKETGADVDWVTDRFSALDAVLVDNKNVKHEELDSKPDGPYTTNSEATIEGIKSTDVADRGDVPGAGREEALKADATQDLNEETASETGETEVDNKTAALLKEAMTSRDFRLIAGILAQTGADQNMIEAFAQALGQTNPMFDYERFVAAAQGSPMSGRDAPGYRPYSCFRCGDELDETVKNSKVCLSCNHELLKLALPQPDGTDGTMGIGAGAEGPGVQELPQPVNPNIPYACKICGAEGEQEEILAHINRDHADVLQRQQEMSTDNMGQDNLGVTAPLASTKELPVPLQGTLGWEKWPSNNELLQRVAELLETHPEIATELEALIQQLGITPTAKTADVPQPTDQSAEVQPLPENPGDRFDEYVQRLAETAAARKFSQLTDEDIHSISSQIAQSPDDIKNAIKIVAVFGDQVGVNGQLGGDPSAPEGYEEVPAQGLSGQQNTHDALVPTDLILQQVASDLNMSPDLAYNMVKDKYGADLPDKYHASISGQVHYYLPSGMAMNQQQPQNPEVGPAAPPASQLQPMQQPMQQPQKPMQPTM